MQETSASSPGGLGGAAGGSPAGAPTASGAWHVEHAEATAHITLGSPGAGKRAGATHSAAFGFGGALDPPIVAQRTSWRGEATAPAAAQLPQQHATLSANSPLSSGYYSQQQQQQQQQQQKQQQQQQQQQQHYQQQQYQQQQPQQQQPPQQQQQKLPAPPPVPQTWTPPRSGGLVGE